MNTAKKIAVSTRPADKFVVRFPGNMRDQIAEVARRNHRSMNSEIVARIETSLKQDILTDAQPVDSSEITSQELNLLGHFRQLSQRQQNALLALIAYDLDTPDGL